MDGTVTVYGEGFLGIRGDVVATQQVTVDAEGKFSFDLQPGRYIVVARHDGHELLGSPKTVDTTDGTPAILEFDVVVP